jgi:hypothetical protein
MMHDDERDSTELSAPIAELAALYPVRAEREWDALAARIVRGAAPELARRRRGRVVMRPMLRWSRPLATLAAAVLLIGTFALTIASDAEATPVAPTFAEVVDREPASVLLSSDRPPSASDLARALDEEFLPGAQP